MVYRRISTDSIGDCTIAETQVAFGKKSLLYARDDMVIELNEGLPRNFHSICITPVSSMRVVAHGIRITTLE